MNDDEITNKVSHFFPNKFKNKVANTNYQRQKPLSKLEKMNLALQNLKNNKPSVPDLITSEQLKTLQGMKILIKKPITQLKMNS